MSSGQGWLESDEDYRKRVAREADERTIENLTGSAPSRGFFESDDSYLDRISREANERRIEKLTGSSPSRGWLESDDSYRGRIAREANERTIEASTGAAPSRGWFESDEDYDTRVRKEANERVITGESGSVPKQGWLEGDYEYRRRIAHEAREVRARQRPGSSTDNNPVSSYSYGTDYSYSPDSYSSAHKPGLDNHQAGATGARLLPPGPYIIENIISCGFVLLALLLGPMGLILAYPVRRLSDNKQLPRALALASIISTAYYALLFISYLKAPRW